MTNPRLQRISPVLPVADVRASVEFYVRHLGFVLDFIVDDDSYALVERDGQALHLTGPADAQGLAAMRNNISMLILVDDVDALWAEVTSTDPPTKTRPPEDMPWGVREFHILDLDGALLRFGTDMAG